MDFKAEKRTIEGVLSSKKQFVIPRFQREYSWEKLELKEFFEDIIARITIKNDDDGQQLDTTDYFFGSLLLVGDINDQKEKRIDVIDGQQRLTTITIFLSALYRMLNMNQETELADKIWEYIINKDNNLKEFSILSNETPRPYFQFLVQTKKSNSNAPKNTEEENIENAYKFFVSNLSEKKLRKRIFELTKIDLNQFNFSDILKTVRDQLLRSVVICICSSDKQHANMIFEILNAKGKGLASIDLIKNKIFEVLSDEEPADFAKEKWKEIKRNLSSRDLNIDFSIFYRHFWTANYAKAQDNRLFSSFEKLIVNNKDENETKDERYERFLEELVDFSGLYIKVLKPDFVDFNNHKHYGFVLSSLDALHNIFNVVQVRLGLLSLFDAHLNKQIITFKQFKKYIKFLENFHFAYNVICSKRTSGLEKPYSKFAINLHNCITIESATECLKEMENDFLSLLPTKEDFIINFEKLSYYKNKAPLNQITKYTVNNLERYFSGEDILPINCSIEHIINEDKENSITNKIGNLISLENKINNEMPSNISVEQKMPYYKESKFKSFEDFFIFFDEQKGFDINNVSTRTNYLANLYYNEIILKQK